MTERFQSGIGAKLAGVCAGDIPIDGARDLEQKTGEQLAVRSLIDRSALVPWGHGRNDRHKLSAFDRVVPRGWQAAARGAATPMDPRP
jgi:hypothetical protein